MFLKFFKFNLRFLPILILKMKRKITTVLLIAATLQFQSQIFSSGFENNNGTPLSSYTKINADGLTVPFYAPVLDFDTEAWIQFYDGYDNKIAMSTSWYDPAGTSNDWLITPSITIPATGNPTLYWKAKSYDLEKMDSYDVKISTTNNQQTSFTTTLLSVTSEQPYDFNSRTLDLSAYKGQTIYLAFINKTTDGMYLALDDLYISNSTNCILPSLTGFNSTNLTENSFTVNWNSTAGITNYDTGLTTFTVPVSSTGIQTALTKSFSGLQPATRYQFFLKNGDCGSGWATPKSVWTAALPPYSYDFEYTAENYGEYDSDGWTSGTWVNGTGSASQSGSGYVFNNTSKSFAKNDWIFSYPIKANAGDEITIKYFAQMSTATATPATLKVSAASAPNKESNIQELSSNTISGGNYVEYTSTFTAPESKIYYFGFGNVTPVVAVNASLRLDNVRITKTNLAVQNASAYTMKVYPNPVKDILYIQSGEKIDKTEVYSVDGKLIKTISNSDKVDFSNVVKGIYILKIYTKSGVKTEKIIK